VRGDRIEVDENMIERKSDVIQIVYVSACVSDACVSVRVRFLAPF
jgi:hypothetical protein